MLTWSHECIVGVEAMDDQHGVLMDTLNDLRLMLVGGAERRAVCLQLELLIEFTQMHFQSEERLLQQHGFPGARNHESEHQHLIAKLYTALEQLNHEDDIHLSSLLEFLPSWYLDHVEKQDQPYGAWLNEHGVF